MSDEISLPHWLQLRIEDTELLLGTTLAPSSTKSRTNPQPYLVNFVLDIAHALQVPGEESQRFLRLCAGELGLLVKDLDYVFLSDRELHEGLRRPLKRAMSIETFVAARAELRFATSLLRVGARVRKSESPDLRINHLGEPSFAEVTSVHATGTYAEDGFAYKVQYALNDKFAEPYANARTVLVIEATHLVKRAVEQRIFSMAAFRKVIDDARTRTPYGSTILLYSLSSIERSRHEAIYQRADSPAIDQRLKALLDESHPIGRLEFGPFEVLGKR